MTTKEPTSQEKFAARLAAVQALYEKSQNGREINDLIDDYLRKRSGIQVEDGPTMPFDSVLFKQILTGAYDRSEDVASVISAHLGEKDIEPLMKSVLLAGGYELLAHQDIDFPIIINDYLNVTHSFYDQSETGLINGVLDNMAKTFRNPAAQ